MVDTDILSKVWEETKCSINESKTYHRTDMVWNFLCKALLQLSSKTLPLLTIPHSMLRRNVFFPWLRNNTKHLSSLDHSLSLNSIMLKKMNILQHFLDCKRWKLPKDLLMMKNLLAHNKIGVTTTRLQMFNPGNPTK